jgi:hypothetical protein
MQNLPQIVKIVANIAVWLLAAVAAVTAYLFFNPTPSEQPKPADQGCVHCEIQDGSNNV